MKIHTKVSRIIKFIDLDIKIFTDFINIILQILILVIVYVPLLALGILALVWVVEHLKLIYVIFIPFLIFGLFCKICSICGIGLFIGVSAIGLLIACIFKITWLGVITGVILLIRIEANDLLKEHEY